MNYEELLNEVSRFLSDIKNKNPETRVQAMTAVLHTLARQYDVMERVALIDMINERKER